MTAPTDTSSVIQNRDYPYFRRLWKNVIVALLAASFIPLILIGGGMYYYASTVIRQKTLEALTTEVRDHRDNIDRFLTERTLNLKIIAANHNLAAITRPGALEVIFDALQENLQCFTDLGIIDAKGDHLAYVGPYELMSKNYLDTTWFNSVMNQGIYISDVFLGFRKVPHFVIAVRQTDPGGTWILRATVDMKYFNEVVAKVAPDRRDIAYLINQKGVFQTHTPAIGNLMQPSEFTSPAYFQGVNITEARDRIYVMTWLQNVRWMCVVQADQQELFASLSRVRLIGIYILILSGIMIIGTVLLSTSYLVSRLETKRQNLRRMDQQLRRTSTLASTMQMSEGFLRQIRDNLANIDVAATWIRHMPETPGRDELDESLDQIRSEVGRSRKSIDNFINLTRFSGPMIMDVDVNRMLNDLLEIFERELEFHHIRVVREFQDGLGPVRTDPARLRQVFQNLLLNAIAAIGESGVIHVRTCSGGHFVSVEIKDDGPGIAQEDQEKIFEPLFSTRAQGLGLGLSICRNNLEKLGARISVASRPDHGAAFRVDIPEEFKPSGD